VLGSEGNRSVHYIICFLLYLMPIRTDEGNTSDSFWLHQASSWHFILEMHGVALVIHTTWKALSFFANIFRLS
jgi:hypothetical protein